MTLRNSLIEKKALLIPAFIVLLGLVSCVPRISQPMPRPTSGQASTNVPVSKPEPVLENQPPTEKPLYTPEVQASPPAEAPKPRMLASLELTRQAEKLIQDRDADGAIRLLERAIVIDPTNGRNYYYLSEAWRMKGNIDQAVKFNELADIHLSGDPEWQSRIADQKRRASQVNEYDIE